MEHSAIELITNRLKTIPETQFQSIVDYLDYLTFKIKGNFNLSEKQLMILEESSHTPLSECRSAKEEALKLREKYK